jgi:hypothetical protein
MPINRIREITFSELRTLAEGAPQKWTEIIVHHFSSPSATQYRGRSTWNGVWNYHVHSRGWSDIGYHCGVGPDGSYWLLRQADAAGYKGPFAAGGAHCVDHNSHGLGIVLGGDFDHENPHDFGWDELVDATALLADVFDIEVNHIYPHRAFANKTCPGNLFNFTQFRQDVADQIGGNVTAPDVSPELPENAVVLGSSYVTTDVIWKDGRGYASIADIYKSAGWTVKWERWPDGKNRWYPKSPDWN